MPDQCCTDRPAASGNVDHVEFDAERVLHFERHHVAVSPQEDADADRTGVGLRMVDHFRQVAERRVLCGAVHDVDRTCAGDREHVGERAPEDPLRRGAHEGLMEEEQRIAVLRCVIGGARPRRRRTAGDVLHHQSRRHDLFKVLQNDAQVDVGGAAGGIRKNESHRLFRIFGFRSPSKTHGQRKRSRPEPPPSTTSLHGVLP